MLETLPLSCFYRLVRIQKATTDGWRLQLAKLTPRARRHAVLVDGQSEALLVSTVEYVDAEQCTKTCSHEDRESLFYSISTLELGLSVV